MNNLIKYQKEIETSVSSLQKGETLKESYQTSSVPAKLLIEPEYNEILDTTYDGEYVIGRLAARVYVDNKDSSSEKEDLLQRLLIKLNCLSVRPNCVFKNYDNFEVVWYPKGSQIVQNKYQYTNLLFDFRDYLDESPIDGISFINTFGECPYNEIKVLTSENMNFFPQFNSNCFGSNKGLAIDVIKLIWGVGFVSVAQS
ncbi:hypothetical protein [Planococcus soli]|uniref:hypothetical protein n=1 Tax=Planococcus soli TaxID=2666072 RepID=UPI00115E1DA5|nr:hypothetical protein [Planococcus soli]